MGRFVRIEEALSRERDAAPALEPSRRHKLPLYPLPVAGGRLSKRRINDIGRLIPVSAYPSHQWNRRGRSARSFGVVPEMRSSTPISWTHGTESGTFFPSYAKRCVYLPFSICKYLNPLTFSVAIAMQFKAKNDDGLSPKARAMTSLSYPRNHCRGTHDGSWRPTNR